MRKRTGLRNRFRNGRGTYSLMHKSRNADRYGTYYSGKALVSENIAGKSLSSSLLKERAPVAPIRK